ncbi:MAG TPA: GPW/gp25 family protein [Verrucomicrobiae bacterium]
MNAAAIFGQGISFPPRVGPDGRVAWSAGEENVREAIRVVLMTNLKERVRLPEFGGGLKSFLFEPNNSTTHHLMEDRIEKALRQWEPRIVVESVRVEPDAEDREAAVATIHYKLVATQTRKRVTLAVTLRT